METYSAWLALCAGNSLVTGEFPSQRPVTRSFDIFFDVGLNRRLSNQSKGWWFETPSRSLWRHCKEWDHLSTLGALYQNALRWRHNDHNGVSNHQPHGCLLNRLFRHRSKKNIKAPRHWPLWGEFTGTGEFPAQRASNVENVSIWWRHHGMLLYHRGCVMNDFPIHGNMGSRALLRLIMSHRANKRRLVCVSVLLYNWISLQHDSIQRFVPHSTAMAVAVHDQVRWKIRVRFRIWTRESNAWWRHQMEPFSTVPMWGESTGHLSQRPVTRSFDLFISLRPE